MAKEYAKAFYSSKAWQDVRNHYAARRHHLCENCMAKNIYRPGEIVHHKEQITPANIERPEVTLNEDNLLLLCRECHEAVHRKQAKRYVIGENGEVMARD